MRLVSISRPFAGGYRSDAPDYALNLNESSYAQDVIAPKGIARQRWGWALDGTSKASTYALVGINRMSYPFPGSIVTTATDVEGYVFAHNDTTTGTALWTNPADISTTWIPRCMYGGDVIYCAQDGETPLLRYAGASFGYADGIATPGSGTWYLPKGSASLKAGTITWPVKTSKGTFITATYRASSATNKNSKQPMFSVRALATDDSLKTITVEGIRNATTTDTYTDAAPVYVLPVGTTYPCVSIHDTGTVASVSSGNTSSTITMSSADLGSIFAKSGVMADALMIQNNTPGDPHDIGTITAVDSTASTITVSSPVTSQTNAAYKVLRRCPFKDATVHKGSFWGTGVNAYPNRVYAAPPLWNMGIAPTAVEPYDPTEDSDFVDVADFLMMPIDVPSAYDGDPVVAILPSNGPLLVLKRASVYGIYGTHPSFEQTLITNGSGCVDLRSAINVDGVSYWAGKDGIYLYNLAGQIQNITAGRIEREWQGLMRGYNSGSWVTSGVIGGYLIVSCGNLDATATTAAKLGPDESNPERRTFIYDLRQQVWLGRISNMPAQAMHSTRVSGEVNALLWTSQYVTGMTGYVADAAPMITGTKVTARTAQTTTDASSTDYVAGGPAMEAWTGFGLAQAQGVEGEARFCDLAVHTNIYDGTNSPQSYSSLSLTTAHGDGLFENSTSTKSLTAITGDTTNRIDRSKRKINKTGRLHQLRVEVTSTSPTLKNSEIPEVVATFRDTRRVT
jgi:hypothetical protein